MKDPHRLKNKDETLDTFYHGRILVLQKRKGYRFSVDAPLLADFIETRPTEELLELGGGCGIISLLLSQKVFRHLVCLEVQPALADLAKRNVQLNQLEERITVIEADLRTYAPGKKFDVIFSNPPYYKKNSGWLSVNQEKAIARHEILVDVAAIMTKTAELLQPAGRAYFIYRASRYQEVVATMKEKGLFPWHIRWVYPRRERPAQFFLLKAGFRNLSPEELPPLVLFQDNGEYTEEAQRIFAGSGDNKNRSEGPRETGGESCA